MLLGWHTYHKFCSSSGVMRCAPCTGKRASAHRAGGPLACPLFYSFLTFHSCVCLQSRRVLKFSRPGVFRSSGHKERERKAGPHGSCKGSDASQYATQPHKGSSRFHCMWKCRQLPALAVAPVSRGHGTKCGTVATALHPLAVCLLQIMARASE